MVPSRIHYCRLCEYIDDSTEGSSHVRWLDHSRKEHGSLGGKLALLYVAMGCTSHCLGRPMNLEIKMGRRLWGNDPTIPKEPPLRSYEEMFPPEDS